MQTLKRTTSLILFSFLYYGTYGKTKALSINPNDSNKTKPYKIIVFYRWGLADFGTSDSLMKCENSLQHKYGFTYKQTGNCMNATHKKIKWRWHNKKCEWRMRRRFGADWWNQYEKELDNCSKG